MSPLPRTMHDREHLDFAAIIVDFVNNDVWVLDQFTRSWIKARPSHVREAVRFQESNSVAKRRDHHGGLRVVLRDPRKYSIEIIFRKLADGDLHIP
jgi:hypothetical protein